MADLDITLRGSVSFNEVFGTTTVTSASAQVDDYLLVFADVDFRPSGQPQISATSGVTSWVEVASAVNTGNSPPYLQVRAWLGRATTSGAKSVTVTQGSGGGSGLHVHCYVLNPNGGEITVDGVSTTTDSTSPYTHSSISPAGTKSWLFCAHGLVQFGGSSAAYGSAPSGMTATTRHINEWSGMQTCRQTLTSSGATGSRSQTSVPTTLSGGGGAGVMFALRSQGDSDLPVDVDDELGIVDSAGLEVTVEAADSTSVSETVAVGIPIDRADSLDVDDAAVADAEAVPQDAADVAEQIAFDASLGTADSATVTATPAMDADLTVADTPLDVDDDIVIINVAEDDHDTDEDVHIDADLQVADSVTFAEGSSVESLYADLAISVYIVDPGDQHLIPLPDFTELTLSPQRNSPGSITLRYPSTGLNFPVLRDNTIDSDRDVEIEIWTSGTALGARRGYLQEAAGDDVAESVEWTFTGGFAELRLSEAVVYPQPKTGVDDLGEEVKVARSTVTTAQWNQLVELGYTGRENDEEEAVYAPSLVVYAVRNGNDIPHLADPKRELKFNAVTPGELVGFIMDQARARGTLDDIALDFTSERDTAGNLWLKQITTKYSPGTGYNQILDKLVDLGLCEWAVAWDGTKRVLQLWIPEGRGQDRTVGLRPVVLRRGRNLTEAPRKWTVRDSATAVMAAGAEGIYVDETSLDAQSRRGRRIETAASGGNGLITEDAVEQYAETHLKSVTPGVMEVTHGLGFLTGEPRPVIAFDVGDWVYSQTSTSLDRLRVVQWTLTVSEGRHPEGTVTLNDAVQDYLVRLNNRLNAITSGETVVGTSEDPAEQNTGTPNPPTGLVIASGAFNTGMDAYAVVNLGWAAPTTNTDNSALTDLSGFRVEWTEEANPDNWRFAADVGAQATVAQWTTAVGLPILYRVRAYNRRGVSSVWATGTTSHTTETDTDPPGVPSAPVGGGGLGLIDFRWDGLTEDDADMLQAYPDLKWVELHLSTSSLFTPDESTLADHVFGKGTYTYSQLPDGTALNYETTYFCRLVAVDRLDNKSDASGQGSAIPGQVLSPDIFDGAVGSLKLADAAVIEAKIQDLAVTDAKIQSLSVGKLTAGIIEASMILGTGKIATGTTGARTELDSAGFRLYNSTGDMTVQMSSANGSAMISGEYRTSLTTGLRLVFNPNGAQPDEIRFYPASTNQYGRMKTVTSVATGYENQAGMIIKGHSQRGDQQSGEMAVFPSYAALAWGNELGGGNVTARISASQAENFLGGTRNRISAPVAAAGTPYYGVLSVGSDLVNHDGTPWGNNPTVLTFTAGGNGTGSARLWQYQNNSGIQFDRGNGEGIISFIKVQGGFCRTQSLNYDLSSSRAIKQGIRQLRGGAGGLDPLALISNVRARTYQLRADKSGARQVGLIAEELPELLRGPKRAATDAGEDGEDGGSGTVSMYALITTVWEAVAQLKEEVDGLSSAPDK